jgi:hypothetical protein
MRRSWTERRWGWDVLVLALVALAVALTLLYLPEPEETNPHGRWAVEAAQRRERSQGR